MDSASGPLRKDDRAKRDACIVQPCIGFGRSCLPVYDTMTVQYVLIVVLDYLLGTSLSVLRGPRTQTDLPGLLPFVGYGGVEVVW